MTASTYLLKKLSISTIQVGDSTISGVISDSHLSMEQQVSALSKLCGHQIHIIGKIVKLLTLRATEQLVHSFVISSLNTPVERRDVTGNRFEWELGENKVI